MNKNRDGRLIDEKKISEMLYGEESYMIEFAQAAIDSFSEFSRDYVDFVLNRDLDGLRRAGHKIKPVAEMLELNEIVKTYEKGKTMLIENHPQEDLKQSVVNLQALSDKIIDEFESLIYRFNSDQ